MLGSSSDHLIVDSGDERLAIGCEVRFQLAYGALLRAMTSPFVAQVVIVAPDREESGWSSVSPNHDPELTYQSRA